MQGKVLFKFLLQTVVDVTRSDKLTFLAEERRVVDAEEHRHGRLVDGDRWQGLGILNIADGVTNLELLQTDDSTDVATVHLIDTRMTHTVEGMQFLDLCLLHRTVAMGNGNLHAVLQLTTMYATYGDTTRVRAIVERCDEHLGRTLQLLRCRDDLDNLI